MEIDKTKALVDRYRQLKAKLPASTMAANEADATARENLPKIEGIRDRVFQKLRCGQPVSDSEAFISLYGEQILIHATSSLDGEWLNLSREIASLADKLARVKLVSD